MKRFYTILFSMAILISLTGEAIGQSNFTVNWERKTITANNNTTGDPAWFNTGNQERGLSYGRVNGNHRVFVASRGDGNFIRILNADTGADVGTLSNTGITGGTFIINDVEVSEDGIVFASNLSTNVASSAFKVYRWDTEASTPVVAVNFLDGASTNLRLGDSFTVTGSVSNNSAKIWAVSAFASFLRVYVWSMADGVFNSTPTILPILATGAAASVAPLPDGRFLVNQGGAQARFYNAAGTQIGIVATAGAENGTNAVKYIGAVDSDLHFVTFSFVTSPSTVADFGRSFKFPASTPASATGTGFTSSLRTNANAGGTGDVAVRTHDNGTFTVYVLGTNNGVGSYTSTFQGQTPTFTATLTGSSGFRTLASPVANTALSTLFGSIWTQGFTGADATNGGSNIYFHPNGSNNFVAATNITNTITAGHGVLVGVYADDDYGTEGVQGGFPKTLSVTGIANSGDVVVTPSHTTGDEYFLAGNPYNATIDWDLVTKGTNVYPIAWVLGTDGEFDSWNGSVGDLTNGLIAPFQGFFYAYSGATSGVTFTTGSQTSGGTFRGKEQSPVAIRLALSRDGHENSTWLQFAEDGTFGRDAKDAPKMASLSSDVMQIATQELESGAKMDIHYLPLIRESIQLPMSFVATRGGEFELSTSSSTLPEGWSLSVHDAETGTTTALVNGESFRFKSPARAASDPVRFSLIVEPSNTTNVDRGTETVGRMELDQNYPNPFNPSTQIRFALRASHHTRLTVYDVVGREVAVLVNGVMPAGAHSVSFDASNLSSGVYLYKLEAGGQVLTRRMTLMK